MAKAKKKKTTAAATTAPKSIKHESLEKLEDEIVTCREALAEAIGRYNAAIGSTV